MGGESFHAQPVLGSAALGFVEVTATLARKQLAERMDDATLAGFFERLEKDWDDFYQVHLDQAMLEAAVAFARTLRLRGADAIHLAAAARLSQHLLGEADQFLFVASDADLKSKPHLSH
jgi:predicted nucleic acid-binding protein